MAGGQHVINAKQHDLVVHLRLVKGEDMVEVEVEGVMLVALLPKKGIGRALIQDVPM